MICGHKAVSAGDVVVKCCLPFAHEGLHKGPRAEGETFSWNSDRYSKSWPPDDLEETECDSSPA